MTATLKLIDLAALSPLLFLVFGALGVLLIESFSSSKRGVFWLTMITIIAALVSAWIAPVSHGALLTPWLRFDALAKFFTIFFLVIGLASTLLAASFFQRFEVSNGEYFFLFLSCLFGLILIGAAADFLTLFLGLETLSIALYVMCDYMKKWGISHEAALKYFIIGSLASAFLLYGIALIYGATGSTQFAGLLNAYQGLEAGNEKGLFLSGIAFVTLGLAFKAAIVPFHVWAPDVYEGAPNPVTAFMAVGTKTGAFAAFIRVFLEALPHFNPLWTQVIALLAYATLLYANTVALRQVQLRRFFAYSGIAHAGFLLMPLVAGTPEALASIEFYLVIYALATLGAFAVLAFLDQSMEGVVLRDLQGLFRRSPLLACTLALCLLTLAGIPPTAGFFAKFYVFKVTFQAGYYGLVTMGLLTAILSAFYYLRIVAVMLSGNRAEDESTINRSWPAAIVGALAFVAILLLSLYPTPILQVLDVADK